MEKSYAMNATYLCMSTGEKIDSSFLRGNEVLQTGNMLEENEDSQEERETSKSTPEY